jgi:hypothetical protein
VAVLPLIMTSAGLQPQSPINIRNAIVSSVAATNPDYTANLPGSLIEDICSTDIAAIVESDSFLVDLVNSISPNGANPFILGLFGQLYGLTPQLATNTSVFVVFFGPPGFVIVEGFTVTDGNYSYVVKDGGIIGVSGQSAPLYAISPTTGIWAVPAGVVNQLATSVPSTFNVSCINQEDGFPSSAAETIPQYHDRVMTAGLAASTGMARYVKTLLANIPGVQTRLVSVVQNAAQGSNIGTWTIICGGGDPYAVANAIFQSDFYLPGLSGSIIEIANVSNTNPVVITTSNNHNLATGDIENITGVIGIPSINNNPQPITVIDAHNFSMPLSTVNANKYQSGGVVTPNPINNIVTIYDYPDSYAIPYVIPPQETVTMVVTWASDSPNYVSQVAMSQAAVPALTQYINSLPAGTTPINLNVLTEVFLDSIDTIVPPESIISLIFNISIDGIGVLAAPGTQVIYGDPFSYFYTSEDGTGIVVQEFGQQ